MFKGNIISAYAQSYEFKFNNKNSLDFGLLLEQYPSIPRLNENIESIKIGGKSGTVNIRDGTYDDREIKFKVKAIDPNYFWNLIDEIEEWLFNIKNNQLIYERTDRCFIVKRVVIGDISKEIDISGTFEITFICEPFMQDILPIIETIYDKNTMITNNGYFDSDIKMSIWGSGNIQVQVNEDILTIKNVKDKVIVDSKLLTCIDGENKSKLLDMNGDFPIIKVGDNQIILTGDIKKATIEYTNLYR